MPKVSFLIANGSSLSTRKQVSELARIFVATPSRSIETIGHICRSRLNRPPQGYPRRECSATETDQQTPESLATLISLIQRLLVKEMIFSLISDPEGRDSVYLSTPG
jgi:hypothetical protein